MAFGFSKTRYSPIAIDFGADSLKLLQITPGQPAQLVAAAAETIPASARRDPAAREAFLSEALPRLLKSQPFKGRRAICSLPAFQTIVQHLELPRSEGAELQAQLEQQLRQRLEIDARRMVVRHVPVGAVDRQGGQQMEVLCLAAPRDVVMRYIDMASKARLDVVGMHSEPLSICKAFASAGVGGDEGADKATCYIDIGAATTKVIIAQGGQLKFAKTIQAAGDDITRQMASRLSVDFDQARQRRIDEAAGRGANGDALPDATDASDAPEPAMAGVVADDATSDEGATSTGIPALDAQLGGGGHADDGPAAVTQTQVRSSAANGTTASAAADTVECLIDELQLCLRYYQRLCPNVPVDRLVFLGGESRHVTTCQSIARAVRIAAQLGDPLARTTRITQGKSAVGVNLDDPQPGWAVPFGLCLSEANL